MKKTGRNVVSKFLQPRIRADFVKSVRARLTSVRDLAHGIAGRFALQYRRLLEQGSCFSAASTCAAERGRSLRHKLYLRGSSSVGKPKACGFSRCLSWMIVGCPPSVFHTRL